MNLGAQAQSVVEARRDASLNTTPKISGRGVFELAAENTHGEQVLVQFFWSRH